MQSKLVLEVWTLKDVDFARQGDNGAAGIRDGHVHDRPSKFQESLGCGVGTN